MGQRKLEINNFSENENWDELYFVTDGWKTDMEVFNFELQYLRNLMHANLAYLLKDGDAHQIQLTLKKIAKIIVQNKTITAQIDEHLLTLERLVMSTFFIDNQGVRKDNNSIEGDFYEFTRTFSRIKKETVYITKGIKDEKNIFYDYLNLN